MIAMIAPDPVSPLGDDRAMLVTTVDGQVVELDTDQYTVLVTNPALNNCCPMVRE